MKQSPKEWNDILRRFLVIELGLTQLRSEEGLYLKRTNGVFLPVATYVNNIVIAYNCASMFRYIKDKLTHRSKCKELKQLNEELNTGIMRTADGGLFVS